MLRVLARTERIVKLEPGTMVTAHVRLTKPLGQGAMGAVWVADHLTLATQVAVKFISTELAHDNPEIVKRFELEAAMAAQIKSPHVVQTFDRGVMEGGSPYIVMELLEGETLADRLERTGRLSMRQTGEVLTQVARALSKAHEAGIVHRDIKPENIFVTTTEDGFFCKVLDFGIAKHTKLPSMGGITSAGTLIGTPEFMSPEQVMSAKDVDFRADLWALAITAYLSLTGQYPFNGQALGALCIALLKGEFALPSSHRSDLPEAIDRWFARALHREPDKRFHSAREMALAFVTLIPSRHEDLVDELHHSSRGLAIPPEVRAPTSVGLGGELVVEEQPPASGEPAAPAPVASSPEGAPVRTPTLTGASASLEAELEPAAKRRKRSSLALLSALGFVAGMAAVVGLAFGLGGSHSDVPAGPASARPEAAAVVPRPARSTAPAASASAEPLAAASSSVAVASASSKPSAAPKPSAAARVVPAKQKPVRYDHGF